MSDVAERDAIVIGGNLAGLSVAHWLGSFGYSTTLIERAPSLGGVDGSFENGQGRLFDFGMHALDHGRSMLVTRTLEKAVQGRFRRLEKTRSILLGGHLIPYNAPLDQWPEELRRLFKQGEIVDDLGGDLPTRARLAEIYGEAWADFVFTDILRSYPAEQGQLGFGVDESRLLGLIYPWFFPRVERRGREDDAHHRYQSRIREQGTEYCIYPESGGFVGFVHGLRERAEESGVEVLVGAGDLEVVMDGERRRVVEVRAGGRVYRSERVYWCAPPKALLELMECPVFDAAPESFALGSFQFERPVCSGDIEILGGDPDHLINRASFPGKLQGGSDDLIQIEYHFPRGDETHGTEASWWRESWLKSLRALGIVEGDNAPVDFDLKLFPTQFNAFGVEGQPVPEVELPEMPADTNLRPVHPTYQKANINARLPMFLRFLAEDLTR